MHIEVKLLTNLGTFSSYGNNKTSYIISPLAFLSVSEQPSSGQCDKNKANLLAEISLSLIRLIFCPA